jgi:predicted S18 family serine protease
MEVSRKTTLLVMGMLFLNLVLTGGLFWSMEGVSDRVSTIESEQNQITDYILVGGEATHPEGSDTSHERALNVTRATGEILAYDSESDEGVMFEYSYQPMPGSVIYVDASTIVIAQSVQLSLQNIQTAVRGTDYNPATYGMAISMDTPSSWRLIRGESAGVSFAAQLVATDPNYRINESVALTGQVEPDGRIVSVDQVSAKAEAARDNGKTLLVAPTTAGTVDVEGIRMIEVQTLDQALEYALDPVGNGTA